MENQRNRRVAVITGASSGIGKEAARVLVKQGWRVIGLGRNPQRCESAKTEILQQARDSDQVTMIRADLALLADTEKAAGEIAALTDRVDALLNNAGGLTRELQITAEGNENTFASNHLGPFLLTNRLLPLLRASAAASAPGSTRVVNVSSTAHQATKGLDWRDLQSMTNFVSMPAYCRAKLANILFTRELAKRLAADNIVVHAMHPGLVNSNFFNHGDDEIKHYLDDKQDTSKSPAEATDTLVWLASAQEPAETTGDYFYERARIPVSEAAQDNAAAERLWRESEKIVIRTLGK